MKITSIIYGLLIVSLVITTLGIAISDMTTSYSVTYDESELEVFQATDSLSNLTQEIRDKQETQSGTESGIFDIVGTYISKTIDALNIAKESSVVFDEMLEASTDKVGLPSYFYVTFSAMMIIAIILGIIFSTMVKRDL